MNRIFFIAIGLIFFSLNSAFGQSKLSCPDWDPNCDKQVRAALMLVEPVGAISELNCEARRGEACLRVKLSGLVKSINNYNALCSTSTDMCAALEAPIKLYSKAFAPLIKRYDTKYMINLKAMTDRLHLARQSDMRLCLKNGMTNCNERLAKASIFLDAQPDGTVLLCKDSEKGCEKLVFPAAIQDPAFPLALHCGDGKPGCDKLSVDHFVLQNSAETFLSPDIHLLPHLNLTSSE